MLQNKLRVVYIPLNVNSVTLCLRGLAGSNYESNNEIGAAHFIEHLSILESQKHEPGEFKKLITEKGGRITGTTSRDDVAYLVKVLKEDFESGLQYLSELFFYPRYSQGSIERVRSVIAHEINQNKEIPQKHIGRIAYRILYPGQRFATYNTGDIGDITTIKPHTLWQFRNRTYQPQNFVLSICGDLRTQSIKKLAAKHFSNSVMFKYDLTQPSHRPNLKPRIQIQTGPAFKQLHLRIDYDGVTARESEKFADIFLACLLKDKIAGYVTNMPYILDAASFNSNTYGLFGVYTAIDPKHLRDFLNAFFNALSMLAKKPQDILSYKNKLKADFVFTLEKTSLKADYYSEQILYKVPFADEAKMLQNVTQRDVMQSANKYIRKMPKLTILAPESFVDDAENILNRSYCAFSQR